MTTASPSYTRETTPSSSSLIPIASKKKVVAKLSISIVAVHGLNGHRLKTWTSENRETSWLCDKDMLPKIVSNARILSWGYNANVTALMGSTSSDRILQHAHTLVAQLEADRSVTLHSHHDSPMEKKKLIVPRLKEPQKDPSSSSVIH